MSFADGLDDSGVEDQLNNLAMEERPISNGTKVIEIQQGQGQVQPSQQLRKVEYFDCPPNWMQYLKCGPNANKATTKKYVLEWLECHEKELDLVVRSTPMEYFTKKCLQATYISSSPDDNPKGACVMIDQLIKFIDNQTDPLFSEEYREGVQNLLLCTKQEIQITYGVTSPSRTLAKPKMLTTLSDKAKCPVLAAKLIFSKLAKASLAYQQQIGRMILGYEKDRAEWHSLYHSVLRNSRHQDAIRYRFRPDAFELSALSKAFLLDPENQEIQISVLKTLFDCLKQKRNFYLQIGTLEFSTQDAVAEYLKHTVVNAAKEGKKASVRGLLAASQCIGNFRMKAEMRDVELAETLLNKALEMWPTHAKTLCRLGFFHFAEKKDAATGKEKFLEAMKEDPSDSLSTLQYYWLDSANGKLENVEKINKKISSDAASLWPSHVLLDLCFLKGCIYLSVNKTKEALNEWAKAQRIEFQYFMQKIYGLNRGLYKYSWKRKDIKDDEEIEVPMNSNFVESCVRKFVEALTPIEAEDTGFRQLAGILKTMKEARARPFEGDDKNAGGGGGERGSGDRKNGSGGGDGNWREKKNDEEGGEDENGARPRRPYGGNRENGDQRREFKNKRSEADDGTNSEPKERRSFVSTQIENRDRNNGEDNGGDQKQRGPRRDFNNKGREGSYENKNPRSGAFNGSDEPNWRSIDTVDKNSGTSQRDGRQNVEEKADKFKKSQALEDEGW